MNRSESLGGEPMQTGLLIGHYWLVAIYAIAAAAYGRAFLRGDGREGGGGRRAFSTFLLGLILASHSLFIALLGVRYRQFPLVSVHNLLSVLALCIVIVYGLLEWRFRIRSTGVFLLLPAFVLQAASGPHIQAIPGVVARLQDSWFWMHVAAAAIGWTSFLVSAIYGALYLAQHRAVKRKTPGLLLDRLPPLDLLARMNAHAALFGFACLTLSLLLGGLLAHGGRPVSIRDPIILQSIAAWILYGSFAAAYRFFRLRGGRQALASLACFALTVSTAALLFLRYKTFHLLH